MKSNPDTMTSTPLLHSKICRCPMCMKTKVTDDIVHEHEHSIKSTMVDRRDPDNPVKPLMKAEELESILRAGTKVNMLKAVGLNKDDLPMSYDIEPIEPKELTLEATWNDKTKEVAKSGKNANVFGKLGVLAVSASVKSVDIPKMNALTVPKSFLEKYGAELIPLDQVFRLDPVEHKELEELYLVEYNWDKQYIDKYVMHQKGGGGLFVETHPFPHVFTPLSPDCSGALILGVARNDGKFDFAAFEIPFGYTMKIKSNVIHGDSFFVGPYAIALTETELADSVILKQDTTDRGIERVNQLKVPAIKLPLLAEHELANKVNKEMMIQKIRHDVANGKKIKFFKQLPSDVLTEVHNLSDEAQEAFDERFGIVIRDENTPKP